MLKNFLIIPKTIDVFYCTIKRDNFLIFKNKQNHGRIYIHLCKYISIHKQNQELSFVLLDNLYKLQYYGFLKYLEGILNSFKILPKKTLLLRGLGLKSVLLENQLLLKLGYSHDITVPFLKNEYNVIVGKNFITLLDYNKVKIGNFIDTLYRFKKADCYKGRGFIKKEKPVLLKIIKKT